MIDISNKHLFLYVPDNKINLFLEDITNYSEKIAFLGTSGKIAAKGHIYGGGGGSVPIDENLSDLTDEELHEIFDLQEE